jgi:inositol oxygenase
MQAHNAENPLRSVNDWDDDVQERYRPDRKAEEFRDYESAPQSVRDFYKLNHTRQTLDFVLAKEREYKPLQREKMGMWEALERLNDLVDDSDPDTELPQIAHAMQTAERIRKGGHPEWMVLVGLIHDSGKMLCFWGEPQWAVVGDTFPVGCAWSDKVVLHPYFDDNPDTKKPELQTTLGIYEENCGLGNVHMSWGHDEYIYWVVRDSKIPAEGLAMLRYHSFYPWHREGAYRQLMNAHDHEMLMWVKMFNPYDLYSKSDDKPDVPALTPYYKQLISKYLPATLSW